MAHQRPSIVIIVPDFWPTIGGTSSQAAQHARQLIEHQFDVTVVTQRRDASWKRSEQRDGYTIVRLGSPNRGGTAMKLLVARVWWWLLCHRRDAAIVQVIMYPDFAVAAAAAGLGSVTVHTWAGLGDASDTLAADNAILARRTLTRMRSKALRATHHVALTNAIADELRAVGITNQITIIPTPVDTTRFVTPSAAQRQDARVAFGLDDNTRAFAHVGHLRALKRVDAAIDALHIVRQRGLDAVLLVAGDTRPELDDVSDQLHEQVRRLELTDSVRFLGGLSDVRPLLWASDAFVLASDREGLSNALLEALACGVPCIAPPSAGGDQVLNDYCGVVPATNAPEDLAAAMELLADPVAASRLRSNTRETALRYDLHEVTRAYLRLYDMRRAHHIG